MSFAARPIGLVKSAFVFDDVIASDMTNYNLRARAVAAGWNQVEPLIATTTVNSGIVLSANATNAYGFDTGVTFPAGTTLTLVLAGYICGMGGAGNSGAGGPALRAQHPITVNAAGGVIAGGGGGGAAGNSAGGFARGGGGGGRSGRVDAPGGAGAGGASAGNPGTFAGPGSGGTPNNGAGGGAWGAAGGNTFNTPSNYWTYGGAGGAAVVGNANITWVNTGTRYGAIT